MTTFVAGLQRSPEEIEAAHVFRAMTRFALLNDMRCEPYTIGKGFALACAVFVARMDARKKIAADAATTIGQ